jgi:signal transduction histidine kinase
MILTLISLGTYAFGVLAFSVLASTYWIERLRGRARPGGVFPVFTLVCALAFALNLLGKSWLLDVTGGLIPALLFHLVFEEERGRPRWLPALCYAAVVPAALTEDGAVFALAAAGAAALAVQFVARRPMSISERRQRAWTRLLLFLMVATAAASYFQLALWVNLLPDYLVLAFLAVTLYYKERLAFFDLFLKRGTYFAVGLVALSMFFAWSTAPPWLAALLMAPLWLAAPWVYERISQAIDRTWLRRPFSRLEAEHRFIHAIQSGESEENVRRRAAESLEEIFRTKVSLIDSDIVLEPRPDGVPFLSDDLALRLSLSRTLAVVLENVRFRERERSLRLLAGRAELKALRAQINPHFLFNALNAIAGLIHTQPALAEETVERLAEIFRYTLRKSEKEWVRLDEEMEFVAACLTVEQARFGERLAAEIEVEPAAGAVHVPAMCVQPLVENAIKHGTSQVERMGRIRIRAAAAGGRLCVEVIDNGPGFPPDFHLNGAAGHGLRNIAERLSGYYGETAQLRWENRPEGAWVSLEVPCES